MRDCSQRVCAVLAVLTTVSLFGPASGLAQDQSFSIGFTSELPLNTILDSSHPAAQIVRAGTGSPLLRLEAGAGPALDFVLAQSFSVAGDNRRIKLRIKSQAVFHNAEPVRAADVVFSLNRCLAARGTTGTPESVVERADPTGVYSAADVEILLGSATQTQLWEFLSHCPIYEAQSARVFGRSFGSGANFIGSGPFVLTSFRARPAEMVLRRIARAGVLRGQAVEVTLRTMEDAERGLSALRIGTISALFTEEAGVLGKAAKDETLVASNCLGYSVLKRRGFVFPCESEIDLEAITWGNK